MINFYYKMAYLLVKLAEFLLCIFWVDDCEGNVCVAGPLFAVFFFSKTQAS